MRDDESPLRGRGMAADMARQPDEVRRLVDASDDVAAIVARVRPRALHGVVLVGSGPSRHAATYGRWVLEMATGLPVAIAEPELATRYGAATDLRGHLAIAVSRTGRVTSTARALEAMRRGGARCLAITGAMDGPVVEAAEEVLPLRLGPDRAAPSTDAFTSELAALALVAQAMGPVPWSPQDWAAVVGAMRHVLADPEPVRSVAVDMVGAGLLVGLGEGFLHPAVHETCQLVTTTTGLVTAVYTPAELRHGPIGRTGGLPVLCLASPGPCLDDVADSAAWLADRGARVVAVVERPELVPAAVATVPVPPGLSEALAPIVHVVRGQQLAYELSLARHRDPDATDGPVWWDRPSERRDAQE